MFNPSNRALVRPPFSAPSAEDQHDELFMAYTHAIQICEAANHDDRVHNWELVGRALTLLKAEMARPEPRPFSAENMKRLRKIINRQLNWSYAVLRGVQGDQSREYAAQVRVCTALVDVHVESVK